MASVRRELQSLMGRGKQARDVEEPWWMPDYRAGETLSGLAGAIGVAKEKMQEEYGQEILTQQRFDNRLNLPILNAVSDSTIYDNKSIDEIISRLTSIKNEDIKRFPDQSIDFTEKMTGIDWDDLDANKKLELKEELYKGTQEISEFKKFMKNNVDYFSNNRDFSSDSDKVNINLIGGYNQLLKQINTFDPEGTIISEDEQRMMIQSIRDGNPDEIRGRNETIASASNSRQKGYQDQFTNAYNDYTTTNLTRNSPDYKKEEARIMASFEEFDNDLKSQLEKGKITKSEYSNKIRQYAEEPMNWTTMPFGEKQITYNIQEVGTRLTSLEQMMDEADANFEKETGSKYSEWMGKRTPWRKIEDDKKTEFEGEVGESYTEEEHEYLQSLQKDIEPEISGDTVEINNPGNLRFANQTEATGKDNRGFAIFPNAEEGWDALYRQIELDKARDLTLDEFINKYAPPAENDTTAYLKSIQKQLNTGKGTNINKLDTKELAVAIAKQEGYAGTYPDIKDETPPPKPKGIKVDSSLTKVKDGKTVVNYSNASSTGFKKQQTNLNKIASQKYNTKENKNKYSNVRDFAKAKFEEWLKTTDKYGKYAEGDFIYFMPTKVDKDNKINPSADMNRYNLYYPGAFSGAKGDIRMLIKPKVGSGYLGFAKDFDAFREYLQES
jgi:hypothetical protein